MNAEKVAFINKGSGIIWLGNVKPTKNRANPNQGRVYDINGCAPALNTCGGGVILNHLL